MNILKIALAGIVAIPVIAMLAAKSPQVAQANTQDNPQTSAQAASQNKGSNNQQEMTGADNVAIFAGGCFWCVESDFDRVPGVLSTVSGYIGGNSTNPTYKTHSQDRHREAVEITFDPTVTSYEKLLDVFWRSVNPTDAGGQFCDRGHSYTTAVYTLDQNQFDLASASKMALSDSKVLSWPVVTEIATAETFHPAEDYHQDYYQKNPLRYKLYRTGCGRDKAVKQLWGDQAHAGISKH